MSTIYGTDGNVYETGIRGTNSEPLMNKEEFENQSIRDLIFNPILYKEYPYHYVKENKIIFSKLPILEPSLEEEIKYKQLKSNWNMLKEWLNNFHKLSEFEQWEIVKKIQELEQGSDNNE